MGLIDVKHFSKSFGKKTVHRDVTFSVAKGECLGLIGGSGMGKSVILRGLIGLEKADGGSITIDGREITTMRERELFDIRRRVAYVFQGGALFDSMTVFENLAYPLREHTRMSEAEISKRILAQLEEFGLPGAENVYPSNLSGGMQKRVGLARAMMLNPDIILYDEPTAGLDPYNTKRIQEHILRLKARGVTSILVTHDMPTAQAVCDNFAFLKNGRIEAYGSLQKLESEGNVVFSQFINGEAS